MVDYSKWKNIEVKKKIYFYSVHKTPGRECSGMSIATLAIINF